MRRLAYLAFGAAPFLLGACGPKPDHNANWYYYWEKDNVIFGLDRAGSPASRWDWDVDAANSDVFGASHGPSNGYVLTDLNITRAVNFPFPVTHASGNPMVMIGATTAFGIEQTAATMTHEKQHIMHWNQIHLSGQMDSDGDQLPDAQEGIPPYNFIIGNKDTYNLGAFYAPYAGYGDDEFLSRIAETPGLAFANLSKDWSKGGAQWRR